MVIDLSPETFSLGVPPFPVSADLYQSFASYVYMDCSGPYCALILFLARNGLLTYLVNRQVFQFSSRFLLNLVSGVSIFVDAWIKRDCVVSVVGFMSMP